ncbi:response regulator (plasmid) [Rhizobium leguminosarum]|uniref:Response regulator n=1 Tax=Rhizobium leguminosarum bv. viciae TaxID=387 RepID=A0A2L1CNU4_RHILV|nr:response regulator [Rhizobium leguminosarum]MDH6662105.1 DNA-binding NtrC family response regulator [Rhizobium sophorae]AVC46399.1 response regulator [Rhizobium leguminosarum bv. viciae]MBB4525020.1 DNA-binding NtrC family response regulator [Rhizobium leguminosarum]MBY5463991.1 response regulator [Rhizobium leguminosarum]MBY5916545.1 response regulator [Rhizobium leguminosarum]
MPSHPPALVLLLEDEAIIAIDAEEMLRGMGIGNVTSLDTNEATLLWLSEKTPDLAIVDPRLKDGLCSGVVADLVERAIPFIVYSGDTQGATGEHESFGRGVWLSKPCTPDQFEDAVRQALKATS